MLPMATGTLGTDSRVKRLDMDSSYITTFKTVTKSVCFQMTLLLLLVLAALTYDGAFTWWRRHHDGRLVARSSLHSLAASRGFQHIHRHPLRLRTHKHGSGWGQRRTDRGGDCRGCGGKRSRQLEIAIPPPAEYPQQTQHFFQTGDMKSIKHHRIRESNNGSFPQYYPRVTSWNKRRISMVSAQVMSAPHLTILNTAEHCPQDPGHASPRPAPC